MQIKISLESDFCPASGAGQANLVDVEITYDSLGIPYLPAKRLKGCFKQAMREVLEALGKPVVEIELLLQLVFGKSGATPAEGEGVRFTNGYLPFAAELQRVLAVSKAVSKTGFPLFLNRQNILDSFTGVRCQTAIDGETGVAETNSLRQIRYLKKGLSFYITLEIPENEHKTNIINLLRQSCRALRHMGLNRTRGFGLVRCELIETDPINNLSKEKTSVNQNNLKELLIPLNQQPPEIQMLGYRLEIIDKLLISSGAVAGLRGETHVPGSNLLGYFAGAYIQKYLAGSGVDAHQNQEFRRLFLEGGLGFSHGYLSDYDDPSGQYRRYLPVPLIFKKQKDNEKKFFNASFTKAASNDFTDVKGGYTFIGAKKIYYDAPSTSITYHHRRPQNSRIGHATKKEGALFNYEAMTAGAVLQGYFWGQAADLKFLQELVPDQSLIKLGRSKTAEYGTTRISYLEQKNMAQKNFSIHLEDEEIYHVVAATPLILVDPQTSRVTTDYQVWQKAIMEAVPGLEVIDPMQPEELKELEDLQLLNFLQYQTIAGFNKKWNLTRQQYPAFRSGSVLTFRYRGPNKDFDYGSFRLGLRTNEGFGEFYFLKREKDYNVLEAKKVQQEQSRDTDSNNLSGAVTKLLVEIGQREIMAQLRNKAIERAADEKIKKQIPNPAVAGKLLGILQEEWQKVSQTELATIDFLQRYQTALNKISKKEKGQGLAEEIGDLKKGYFYEIYDGVFNKLNDKARDLKMVQKLLQQTKKKREFQNQGVYHFFYQWLLQIRYHFRQQGGGVQNVESR